MEKSCLEFVPWMSSINPSFWNKLTEIKLDTDRLVENAHDIWGYFTNFSPTPNMPALIEVDSTSFNTEINIDNVYIPMRGSILNKNTVEQFKDMNKNELINAEGQRLWEIIKSEEALKNPSLLNYFFILSYADLKKYHYYYWFAFPALSNLLVQRENVVPVTNDFNEGELVEILTKYKELQNIQKPFFVITKTAGQINVETLPNRLKSNSNETTYFAFSDPSTNSEHPGWPLRNYIAFLAHHRRDLIGKTVSFVAFRLTRGKNNSKITCENSLLIKAILPKCEGSADSLWTGWEKNERGKFGPRLANMKNSLDPICLAESAVDLNLKLMKWRLLPDIDLEKIKSSKCLLLGSGTLGCAVARTLLGWGVRNITLVDNSSVSFSNPVRQSLFFYEDCVKNRPKAEAAAENLKKIFPGVNSRGFNLNIPMPGHTIGHSLLEQTKQNVNRLTELMTESDVIFLLMDSRESRWLPTLLGNYLDKVIINSALGFDSYLVMRHGAKRLSEDSQVVDHPEGFKAISGDQLGCYFCSDVTAPGNSLKDRSLDQQCTVSRPGISPIAGALAVELAISVLQHEQGSRAPALYKTSGESISSFENHNECLLGIVPHSVRGFLSTFSHILPAVERYKQCIACSDVVLDAYEKDGFEFLLKVFDSSSYLEEITGLTELSKGIDQDEIWDLSDEDF